MARVFEFAVTVEEGDGKRVVMVRAEVEGSEELSRGELRVAWEQTARVAQMQAWGGSVGVTEWYDPMGSR